MLTMMERRRLFELRQQKAWGGGLDFPDNLEYFDLVMKSLESIKDFARLNPPVSTVPTPPEGTGPGRSAEGATPKNQTRKATVRKVRE